MSMPGHATMSMKFQGSGEPLTLALLHINFALLRRCAVVIYRLLAVLE